MIKKIGNKAVSNIIGIMLLLALTVGLFSVVSTIVLSHPSNPSIPSVNLVGMVEGEYLLIEHRGGEEISLETKIIISIEGSPSKSIIVGDEDYLSDSDKTDNKWGLGEWLFYHHDSDLIGKNVGIAVVDVDSNSVIMSGKLKGS